MANRVFNTVKSVENKVIILAGKVTVASDGSISSYNFPGAERTAPTWGSSKLTVSLDDAYPVALTCVVTLHPASVTSFDQVPHLITVTPTGSTPKVEVSLYDISAAGYAANPAQNVTFNILLVLSNSNVNI